MGYFVCIDGLDRERWRSFCVLLLFLTTSDSLIELVNPISLGILLLLVP